MVSCDAEKARQLREFRDFRKTFARFPFADGLARYTHQVCEGLLGISCATAIIDDFFIQFHIQSPSFRPEGVPDGYMIAKRASKSNQSCLENVATNGCNPGKSRGLSKFEKQKMFFARRKHVCCELACLVEKHPVGTYIAQLVKSPYKFSACAIYLYHIYPCTHGMSKRRKTT